MNFVILDNMILLYISYILTFSFKYIVNSKIHPNSNSGSLKISKRLSFYLNNLIYSLELSRNLIQCERKNLLTIFKS